MSNGPFLGGRELIFSCNLALRELPTAILTFATDSKTLQLALKCKRNKTQNRSTYKIAPFPETIQYRPSRSTFLFTEPPSGRSTHNKSSTAANQIPDNAMSIAKRVLPMRRELFTYVMEPAQPLKGVEPRWCNTPEEAFEKLASGQTVFSQGAAATPQILLAAMTKVGKEKGLKDIKVRGLERLKLGRRPGRCVF